MSKYLSGELIVHKLETYWDITDEYVSSINLELPLSEYSWDSWSVGWGDKK